MPWDCPFCETTVSAGRGGSDRRLRLNAEEHLAKEHNLSLEDLESYSSLTEEQLSDAISKIIDTAMEEHKLNFIRALRGITSWGLKQCSRFADENMEAIQERVVARKKLYIEEEKRKRNERLNRYNTLELD